MFLHPCIQVHEPQKSLNCPIGGLWTPNEDSVLGLLSAVLSLY